MAIPLILVAITLQLPPPNSETPQPQQANVIAAPQATSKPTLTPMPATPTTPVSPTSASNAPIIQTDFTATPPANSQATPTPRPAGTPFRVGLQAGHWKANEQPDELKQFRSSSGAFAAGYTEAQVNLSIAQRIAKLLQDQGIVVDILPATVPPNYDADAFVAIHADGSSNAGARGFKLATPWRTSVADQHLLDTITAEYAAATGLPQDHAISINMRGYYAFNYRRYQHAIAKTTPAVIIEMGFLTNPTDRAMMLGQADRMALGIATGIMRYLNEHDPNDGAALVPPEFKRQRPIDPNGIDVHTEPSNNARVLVHVGGDRSYFPIQERDGWYQIFVRNGQGYIIGWVRADQLTETDEPTPTPLPPADT